MKKTDQHILKAVFALLAILVFLPAAGAGAEDIVSLNKATVEELMAIEDLELDEEIANAIVQYRLKNGEFKETEDLLEVPGMTEDWFEEINPVVLDGDIVYDPDAEDGEPSMNAY
jgi:competence protein ComEA